MPQTDAELRALHASLTALLEHPTPEAEAQFAACLRPFQASAETAEVVNAIRHAVHQGPPPLSPALAHRADLQTLLDDIAALQQFILALGKGDLSQSLALRGLMAGGLKSLQAHLRHLTWQTQQVAKGDFGQRVDFMGDFSEAFNAMVDALHESQARLKQRERELSQTNAELRNEIAERRRIEAQIKRANADLQRRVTELSFFNRITQALANQTHLDEALEIVIRETVIAFKGLTGAIGLLDEAREGQTLIAIYNVWDDGPPTEPIYLPLDEDLPAQRVLETGQSLIVADMFNDPLNALNRAMAVEYGMRCNLTTPLRVRGEIIGTFSVARHKDEPVFTAEDAKLAQTVAGQIAQTLDNIRMFEDMRQARETAEAANRAKSAFLANMSHELRTPLNAILGFSELLSRDTSLTTKQTRNLEIINSSGEHLLALINDVLELSKIESGRVEVQPQAFDLFETLESLADMFRLRATQRGITLAMVCDQETLPQYITADLGKLRQVLVNLLGNAIKFTPEGRVTLQVCRDAPPEDTEAAPEAAWLRFEVADTGVGIARDELGQLFQPFVQTTSGRDAQQGTGLGLSISYNYVRMLGGMLQVTSAPGEGTCFSFSVPVTVMAAPESAPARASEGDERALTSAAHRILVVEDDAVNRLLLSQLLNFGENDVRMAEHGQEALEIWATWRPQLIFMDMRMPVMDGRDATRHIRASARGDEPVIIALTAHAFEEDRQDFLDWGCDDFIRKPFRVEEIQDAVQRHLGMGQDAASDAAPDVSLAALPADLRARLREAAIHADIGVLYTLLDEIAADFPPQADMLRAWTDNFAYQDILACLDAAETS